MTITAADGAATPAAEPTKVEAPAVKVPPVDTQAIEAAADKRAADIADKKIRAAFKSLSGEPEKKGAHPVIDRLIEDPVGLLKTVHDSAVTQAKDELRNETRLEREMASTAQPILDQYPDLNDHLDYVDAKIRSHLSAGLGVREATQKGLEEVSKKLGLKSVSEQDEDRRLKGAGIPYGSGSSHGRGKSDAQAFDNEKSTADFMQGYKDKVKSFKTRKV